MDWIGHRLKMWLLIWIATPVNGLVTILDFAPTEKAHSVPSFLNRVVVPVVVLKFDMLDVLKEWLGDGGKVVDKLTAEKRAQICQACPLNVEPLWWWRFSADPIAKIIQSTLELKNRMDISVSNESHLHMCKACGCAARLKVHVPIEHIIRHTSHDTMTKFDSNCWILKEKESQ